MHIKHFIFDLKDKVRIKELNRPRNYHWSSFRIRRRILSSMLLGFLRQKIRMDV
jgi:hypothetical protein